jgi:hypothetical protein
MAWGTTGITEDELKRIAAVREYLCEHFPSSSIRDSYDPSRLAQVFRIELDAPKAIYTTVISTEFLKDHPPSSSRTILTRWRVADHLRAAKGADVLITSWGVDTQQTRDS